jgi:hypothetical protein
MEAVAGALKLGYNVIFSDVDMAGMNLVNVSALT